MRICSFLPSATEIVYALGLEDNLYGVSHECDFPPEARSKPRIVKSKFDSANLTSKEIDSLVRDLFSRGERIYEVDQEVLKQANPDLVITQELCDVCAISYEDVQQAVVHLDVPPQIISLDPGSLADVLRDIHRVGEFSGRVAKAQELAESLQVRIDAVRTQAESLSVRPRVACIEWLDPLIVSGHWIPEMVEMAGGQDVLNAPGQPSRHVQIDELVASSPDVLVLMPCGMDVDRGISEFALLQDMDKWDKIPAVQNGNVYAANGGELFSRSGPRLIDGLEIIARMVHPEVFTSPIPPDAARRLESLPV